MAVSPVIGRAPPFAALALLVMLPACASEPVALFLTLDQPPGATRGDTVELRGTVTRIPPEFADRHVPATLASAITVTATGGSDTAVDTAETDGAFTLRVPLTRNAPNALMLVARDARGNISDSVPLLVKQDAVAPRLAAATPLPGQENVSLDPVIEVRFSEPIVLTSGGADLQLVTTAQTVRGAFLLSADSLTLNFFPEATLLTNSVYNLTLTEVTDAAGNPMFGESACFVTGLTGVDFTVTDELGDVFGSSPSPSDLRRMQLSAHGNLLTTVLRFTAPRAFDTLSTDNIFGFLEFDIDQDSLTGFTAFKDFVFSGLGPEFSSGTGVEYVVGVEQFTLGDSAYVGRYVDDLFFEVITTFIPDFCREFIGFAVPIDALTDTGGMTDDGNLNLVTFMANLGPNDFSVDPTPTGGHLVVNFAGRFTAAPFGAPAASRGGRRLVRLQPRVRRPF